MRAINFNQLPLETRKSILFPKAKLMSASQNETYRIAFFEFKGEICEVCYDLASEQVEDIRLLSDKVLDSNILGLISE